MHTKAATAAFLMTVINFSQNSHAADTSALQDQHVDSNWFNLIR
jgi:hypothetical protein